MLFILRVCKRGRVHYNSFMASTLFNTNGLVLGFQAEFRRLKRMFLRHRGFRAIQAVADQVSEKWESNLAPNRKMLLVFVIDEIHMIACRITMQAFVLKPT